MRGRLGPDSLERRVHIAPPGVVISEEEPSEVPLSEDTPLLRKSSTRLSLTRSLSRHRRRSSIQTRGDATVTQAVLMVSTIVRVTIVILIATLQLLKSFIGTGILFLGKAFFNGGILFSACALIFIAMVSLFSFLLLVETKNVVPGSFGGWSVPHSGHYIC